MLHLRHLELVSLLFKAGFLLLSWLALRNLRFITLGSC